MSNDNQSPQMQKYIVPRAFVQLGDRSYLIKMLPSGKSAQWREIVEPIITPLLDGMNALPNTEINTPRDLLPILMSFKPILLKSISQVIDAVRQYSPEINDDWDNYLSTDAYDPQWIDVFVTMLRFAFPLEHLRTTYMSEYGPSAGTTLQNSHATNGKSATTIKRGKGKPKTS